MRYKQGKQPKRQMQLVGEGLENGWLLEYDDNLTTTQVVVTFTDIPGPFDYEVTVESYVEARTKPQITNLELRQKDPDHPAPIQNTTMKKVPLQLLRDRASAAIAARFAAHDSEQDDEQERQISHSLTVTEVAENMSLHRPRDGKRLSDDHYRQLSWWYCLFLLQGFHPRKSLAAKYQRHPVTVSRWIAEARRRGHLPPYEPVRGQDRLEKWKSWDRSGELLDRQIASRVLTQQLEMQVRADLDRSLVDSEAGQDVIGAFVKAIADGSDDLSQDVRTLVTIKVLEEIAASDSEAIGHAAREFLSQLNATIDGQA